MRIVVTTVSRKAQSLQDIAAAAFVVTNEDIRRSGVAVDQIRGRHIVCVSYSQERRSRSLRLARTVRETPL